jgi:hypothetical protein
MTKKGRKKRVNTYFRQTAKAFKAARQTQIFSHIRRNIPHNIYKYSKSKVEKQIGKVRETIGKKRIGWVKKIKVPKKPQKQK